MSGYVKYQHRLKSFKYDLSHTNIGLSWYVGAFGNRIKSSSEGCCVVR